METKQEHYESMMQAIARYAPSADLEVIQRAYAYADEKHKNQLRKSGEPYIIHPLAVAEIVAEIGLDTDAIAAALLHDCLEDTDASFDSHLLTALSDTYSVAASSFWVIPFSLRSWARKRPNAALSSSYISSASLRASAAPFWPYYTGPHPPAQPTGGRIIVPSFLL